MSTGSLEVWTRFPRKVDGSSTQLKAGPQSHVSHREKCFPEKTDAKKCILTGVSGLGGK